MKNRYIRFIFLILTGALFSTSCAGFSSQPPTPTPSRLVVLKISGSGTITSVLEVLTPAFERATPGYKLEVMSGNSTGSGVTGILEGLLDAAAMARPPKDEEIAKNIKYYEMGLIGQSIIVHPSVTGVSSLNKRQITEIFSGKVTNWSQVGGANLDLVLYVRDEDDSSTKGLRKAMIGETALSETAKTLFSQSDMIFSVEGTRGAVGIAALPPVLAENAEVETIAINGILPNNASYPILGSAGIGYLAEHESEIKPLIDWLSSDEGQAELKALGFIPTP